MTDADPERGDIIVAEVQKSFPMNQTREVRMVVEGVEEDSLDCGIDGEVAREDVVRVVGKSPDYDASNDAFQTTIVD